MKIDDPALVRVIAERAQPLRGMPMDLEPLLDAAGRARIVLIGEATHGTREFYDVRAELTRRLIVEHGFCGVAIEGDFPDAARVDRFVRGRSDDFDAIAALADFRRFPTWMWRNDAVLAFVDWLERHNDEASDPVGFYGLDLYSLHASIDAVLGYLDAVDPDLAARARDHYACFDRFGDDPKTYGHTTRFGLHGNCENAVVRALVDLQQSRAELLARDGLVAEDEQFFAEQNARVVANAERYYRSMFGGRTSSWNLRDQHMADTLHALLAHLGRRGADPRIVVWAHNSHVGDARATAMGEGGELNIGQIARQRYGADAFAIGFSTFTGTVTAADDWGGLHRTMIVRPALAGSWEALMHATALPSFWIDLRELEALGVPRLQRAIGVVYRPQTERASHYFSARLADQFDALIHIDQTHAVSPMDRTEPWQPLELPETYPTGL